ncbi:hypothetical protein ACWFR5_16985 [Streptomyces sp. NPDC055092]
MSKVILAHLPHHRPKAIYARQRSEIENAGLGGTWSVFRAPLGEIKKDGYVLTVGKFNPGVYSVERRQAAAGLIDEYHRAG